MEHVARGHRVATKRHLVLGKIGMCVGKSLEETIDEGFYEGAFPVFTGVRWCDISPCW